MNRWPTALCLLLTLGACQSGENGEEDDTSRLPVQSVELILQLQDPMPGLDAWLESFERTQGAEVTVRVGREVGAPEASLLELDPRALAQRVAADQLRPLKREAEIDSEIRGDAWSLGGTAVAIPWRLRPRALLLRADAPVPTDWPSMLRQLGDASPWGLETDNPAVVLGCLAALARSAGAPMAPVSVRGLRHEAWAEALAFMTRAVTPEQRHSTQELERLFASGALSMLVADPARVGRMKQRWPQLDLQLAPFPSFDADSGGASVFAEIRVLALPQNGPYPSLAEELAHRLALAGSEPLAGEDSEFLSVQGVESRDEDWGPLMASAFALPLFKLLPEWEDAVGHALEQSLQRRRNPTQAVLDARESLTTPSVR